LNRFAAAADSTLSGLENMRGGFPA